MTHSPKGYLINFAGNLFVLLINQLFVCFIDYVNKYTLNSYCVSVTVLHAEVSRIDTGHLPLERRDGRVRPLTCVQNAAHLPPRDTAMTARQLVELSARLCFVSPRFPPAPFSCFLLSLRLSQRDSLGCLLFLMARFPWRWLLSHSQFLKVVERMSPCFFSL